MVHSFGFEKNTINIYGTGKQVRDILYVTDLVRAFDLFIKSNVIFDVFNIGGSIKNSISLLELLRRIESITHRHIDVCFKEWRPADQKLFIADIAKTKKLLQWEPKIGIDKGLARMVLWIKKIINFIELNS